MDIEDLIPDDPEEWNEDIYDKVWDRIRSDDSTMCLWPDECCWLLGFEYVGDLECNSLHYPICEDDEYKEIYFSDIDEYYEEICEIYNGYTVVKFPKDCFNYYLNKPYLVKDINPDTSLIKCRTNLFIDLEAVSSQNLRMDLIVGDFANVTNVSFEDFKYAMTHLKINYGSEYGDCITITTKQISIMADSLCTKSKSARK